MKIIVGLGNIGEKYQNNRHNCGFMLLDEFKNSLEKTSLNLEWQDQKKLKSQIIKSKYQDQEILLVKPTTLMNLSGLAVSKILNFFKSTPKDLIVIFDDIDLDLGTIRFREKGSAGTHNGMRSVIQEIGTENFSRIRIGIESRGVSSPEKQEISSFVLSDFSEDERKILDKSIKDGIEFLQNHLCETNTTENA